MSFEGYQTAWNGRALRPLLPQQPVCHRHLAAVLIVFLGSLAAYALANWRGRTSAVIYLFFIAGLMIPIRLGTINIFQIVQMLGLDDTVFSLIPVYVAMGLPIAVFVLTAFIRGVPHDLIDAAHVDGASSGASTRRSSCRWCARRWRR